VVLRVSREAQVSAGRPFRDYVFPRAANAIIKDQLGGLGAQVGRRGLRCRSAKTDMTAVIKEIETTQPGRHP